MNDATEIRSVCRMCHGGCGVILRLERGVPVEIRGDPQSPASEGFFCLKGRAALELLNHPERLRQPLLRRGDGHVPIPWDEALDMAAQRIKGQIAAHGPESVLLAQGTDRNYQEWVFRLANSLGTPNVLGPAHVCFYPRVMASILTCGGFTFCDYQGDPDVVVLWGSNKLHTHSDGVIGIQLAKALQRGARLLVIDPRATPQAKAAEHWLRIRPGSDGALALGMLHLIIENQWHDRAFVENFTEGFDALRDHVRAYDPARVAELTGLDAEAIIAATRFYAQAERACIEAGTGLSQNRNAFSTLRSVVMIGALCGNLDAPGGDVMWDPMPIDGRRSFPLNEALTPERQAKRLGADKHPVLGMSGWAHPDAVWDAMIEGRPYPVGTLLNFGTNLLMVYADSQRIHKALSGLDFHLACDLFMTPTARLADLVLPAASWLERDQIVEFNAYLAPRRKIAQVGECRSDEEIILDLARRLGVEGNFWPDLPSALNHKLAGIGHDWESFKAHGPVLAPKRYRKYLERGFRTRSGKVSLFHGGLPRMGGQALPDYRESPPPAAGAYILTSAHSVYFYNSEYRNLRSLRDREPLPCAQINPADAEAEGLRPGDWVRIASADGAGWAEFAVAVSDDVASGVVCVPPSWWYPELDGEAGWQRSNVNMLTSAADAGAEMGSSNFRGITVSLTKVTRGESHAQRTSS